MSWTRIAIVLLTLVLATAAPARAQSMLRIGLNDDPDALDPTISRAYMGRLVFAAFCDKLFDMTPDLKVVPQLATGHEWAANGRSVVIKLRPNVKFHDGEPFNAEAVKFNIERHLTTPGSFRRTEIADIKSVEVVNDLTVRLVLAESSAPLIATLTDRSGMMVSPKAARELGDRFGTRPVCAGPYRFVERVAQGKIVGERFADYWDKGNIHFDRVEFVPILDSTARLASLRSGDLTMMERVPPTDLAQIRADAKLKVVGVAELGYQTIPLNIANGPKAKAFADFRVRQALDLAIDREALIKAVFNNEYIPGNQWVAPTNPYYNKAFPVKKRDVARARQLLREAGHAQLAFTLIVPARARPAGGRAPHPVHARRGGHDDDDPDAGKRHHAHGGPQGRLRGVLHVLERPARPRRQCLLVQLLQRSAERRQVLQPRRSTASSRRPGTCSTRRSARSSTTR